MRLSTFPNQGLTYVYIHTIDVVKNVNPKQKFKQLNYICLEYVF